ncbi:MAG: Spy/CpxP family protein refolding chaperone [Bradyrhizobium sp.]|nr:Spy/CpxP family protein refolding chaperone [Bradyrhizobium sp.]
MMRSMWKFSSLGFVALACAILLSAAAYAGPKGGGHGGGGFHGGGVHIGGFHGGGGHFGGARTFAARPHFAPHAAHPFARSGFHGGRSFGHRSVAIHNAPRINVIRGARAATGTTAALGASALAARHVNVTRNANAVQHALNSRPVNRALSNTAALRDPRTRALVTASVATAAWHGGNWWWRHHDGGFGWVGPVFWPFAFYDIYDYAFWGSPYYDTFWDYGYPDLYAGIFGPYGYDDLMGYAAYLPRYASGNRSNTDAYAFAPPNGQTKLMQMCGEDSRTIAGLPIESLQSVIQPNEAQRAALDELASASEKAAASLKASCPTDVALTAPRRLEVMQQRIEAMIAAVQMVQPPLENFYGLLSDEQKAQFNGLAFTRQPPARPTERAVSAGQACDATQSELTNWPAAMIEQSVKPTEQQHIHLDALQSAAAQAADMLKASCQSQEEDGLTPPARLATVSKRLDTMLQAVKAVHVAMNDFYGSLTDEQKAAFDAIGPQRIGAAQPHGGRRHIR